MKFQILTYSENADPMRGEVWTAMPLVPIPVVERRTLDTVHTFFIVRPQAVSATGKTKQEAVANLKELVLACVNKLDNGHVEEIEI